MPCSPVTMRMRRPEEPADRPLGRRRLVPLRRAFARLWPRRRNRRLEPLIDGTGFTGRAPVGKCRWTSKTRKMTRLDPTLVAELSADHVRWSVPARLPAHRQGTATARWIRSDSGDAEIFHREVSIVGWRWPDGGSERPMCQARFSRLPARNCFDTSQELFRQKSAKPRRQRARSCSPIGLIGLDGGSLLSGPGVIESHVETADNRNDDHDNCRHGGANSSGGSVVFVHDGPHLKAD